MKRIKLFFTKIVDKTVMNVIKDSFAETDK